MERFTALRILAVDDDRDGLAPVVDRPRLEDRQAYGTLLLLLLHEQDTLVSEAHVIYLFEVIFLFLSNKYMSFTELLFHPPQSSYEHRTPHMYILTYTT